MIIIIKIMILYNSLAISYHDSKNSKKRLAVKHIKRNIIFFWYKECMYKFLILFNKSYMYDFQYLLCYFRLSIISFIVFQNIKMKIELIDVHCIQF